ncbi:MAG: MBL fold metallo-hydrolase [Candidatus Jordarchaeales archaeon]
MLDAVLFVMCGDILEEVAANIYKLTVPIPFRGTDYLNIYLLKEDRPAIIDTGIGDQVSIEKIVRGIESVGIKIDDVEYIITTHEHVEHFGGNKDLKDISGAKVFAHEVAADSIEGFHNAVLELGKIIDSMEIPAPEKERLKIIMRFNLMIKVTKVDRRLRDGDRIDLGSRELRVIHTPGHALGHICLYDEERRILFTGDHVLGEGTPFVGSGFGGMFYAASTGKKWWFEGDVDLYIKSLERLLSLELDAILPAHGPVSTNPYERITETLKRKKFRERKLVEILQKGRMDLDTVVRELYGETDDIYLVRGATLGYLGKLVKEGRAKVVREGGKLYFEPA